MLKSFITVFFILLSSAHALAQDTSVTFTETPVDLRIYAVPIGTTSATVKITGNATAATFKSLYFKVRKNGAITHSYYRTIPASGLNFNEIFTIQTGIFNHQFNVYGKKADNSLMLLHASSSVAAGYALVVYGQSNARSNTFNGSATAYTHWFLRTVGRPDTTSSSTAWTSATPTTVGNWPQVMGHGLLTQYNMPIVIINAAVGGKPIDYFQKNYASTGEYLNAYGRLQYRLKAWNLDKAVSGFFWWQGETDSISTPPTTTASYIAKFTNLYTDLKLDWNLSPWSVYMTQLRGCTGKDTTVPAIQEAQRLLSEGNNFKMLAANGLQQHTDNCHYPFANGYEKIGAQWVTPVAWDLFYPATTPPAAVMAPAPMGNAIRSTANDIVVNLKNVYPAIAVDANAFAKFRLEGTGLTPAPRAVSAEVINTTGGNNCPCTYALKLMFAVPTANATGLSYLSHDGGPTPEVWNMSNGANDKALINFFNLPIN